VFVTTVSIVVVHRKSMCGSPVVRTLKTHERDTTRFILVRASEPTCSSVVIIVLGMHNQGITLAEIERDWYPSACRCSSLVSKKPALSLAEVGFDLSGYLPVRSLVSFALFLIPLFYR